MCHAATVPNLNSKSRPQPFDIVAVDSNITSDEAYSNVIWPESDSILISSDPQADPSWDCITPGHVDTRLPVSD